MTTAVTQAFDFNSRPSHLATVQPDPITNALGVGGSRRLSTEGKQFTPMIGGKPFGIKAPTVMGVIVGASEGVARLYYDVPYKPGVIVNPGCYSPKGDVPASNARNKQSDACFTCAKNVKGSGGGERRACAFSKRIAILIDKHVYQLTLPSTSIFDTTQHPDGRMPLKAYGGFLQAHGAPISSVITELSFDERETYPKVLMKAVGWLSEEEHEKAMKEVNSAETARILEYNFDAPQAPAPQAPAPQAPAPVQAAPAVQAPPQAPVATPEPVKVSSGNAPIPAKDDLINQALATWDD